MLMNELSVKLSPMALICLAKKCNQYNFICHKELIRQQFSESKHIPRLQLSFPWMSIAQRKEQRHHIIQTWLQLSERVRLVPLFNITCHWVICSWKLLLSSSWISFKHYIVCFSHWAYKTVPMCMAEPMKSSHSSILFLKTSSLKKTLELSVLIKCI